MSKSDWNHIESYKQAIIDGKATADIWSINDILAPNQQLNEDDAKQILKNVQRYKDADHGINWIVIDSHIDDYLENREENNNA
jgi:hypothetical protein